MSYFSDHAVDEHNDTNANVSGEDIIWNLIRHEFGQNHEQLGKNPPASKTFLREMEIIYFKPNHPELQDVKEDCCPICTEDFKVDEPCHKLEKCKHFFHVNCLKLWLEKHNTCPLCRDESILTDCPEYEEKKLDPNRLKENIFSLYM
ncbi:hypothetical protein ABK040_006107 [Willaertia magna]